MGLATAPWHEGIRWRLAFHLCAQRQGGAMNGVELIRVIHDVLSIVYTIGKVVYRFCNDIHGSARKPARKGKIIRRKRR